MKHISENKLYKFTLIDGNEIIAYVSNIILNDCVDMHVKWLHKDGDTYTLYNTLMQFSEIDEAFMIDIVMCMNYIMDRVPELYDIIVGRLLTSRLGIYLPPNVILDTDAYQKELHKICAGGVTKNGYPKEHRPKVCYYSRFRKR